MVLKSVFKYLSLLVFVFYASMANATTLQITYDNQEMKIISKETVKNTVFERFNDIWIIFSDKNLKVQFDTAKLASFGVTQLEELIMKNSKGFRLRFDKKAPQVTFSKNYEKRENIITLSKVDVDLLRSDTIKFRIESDDKNSKLKTFYLDSAFILDYAYSIQTGEKYLVAISNDERLKFPTKSINNQIYFLPTYSGAAMVSEKGEYLTIKNDDMVELTDEEDLFFDQAVTANLETEMNNFFKSTGIQLIERQLRDYSVFNQEVEDFKSSGEFDDAYNRLNDALDMIEDLNYINHNQKLNPVTTKRLETINIQEGYINDQSSQDDGFFEVDKQVKQELNKPKDDDADVLVPDFSDDNLSFLSEKLRLTVIKQPSTFKKENTNIKRMQIAAYKSYFAEILDLSKLVRLDISGEFPKQNKALALYTLANAKINRCDEIISLPEKTGSVYTKDIKLWKAYCLVNQEKFDLAAGLFENNFSRIKTYPKHLQDDLMLAYAKALQGQEKYLKSSEELKKLAENVTSPMLDEVNFALGINYLFSNEPQLAMETFKALVYSDNKPVRYKARLEYLNLLSQEQDFNKEVIISALEDLRFDFRENKTELEATKALASIYMQEDYLKQAMELYKYISIYFSQTEDAKQATKILFNIFYNLFAKDQQTSTNLNRINKLALFYDFIELTPSDYEGNKIISNVVNNLVDLQLYDNAIKLLTIQLNYKTKNEDVAQGLGEKLAELYLKTGQLKNALKTLILTQVNPKQEDYTDNAKMIKAKVLLKFNKFEEAEKLLKTIKNSLEAKYILADIYWAKGDNKNIIDVLENIFLGKKVELDADGIIHLSYLMVAYSLTKDIEKLQQIKDLYSTELAKVDLAYKLDFLLKLAGEDVQVKSEDKSLLDTWQKIIDIDNQVTDFLKDYDTQVDFRKALIARDYEVLVNKYANRLE